MTARVIGGDNKGSAPYHDARPNRLTSVTSRLGVTVKSVRAIRAWVRNGEGAEVGCVQKNVEKQCSKCFLMCLFPILVI